MKSPGLTLIAAATAFVLSWDTPAIGAGKITFGDAPSFSTEQNFDFAASEDKHAFTLRFSDLQIGEKGGLLSTPVVTRTWSMVVPIKEAEKEVEIPLHFQGYALCPEGVNGYAVFSANGQTSVVNFSSGHDDSFLTTLVFKAPYASDIRLTILIALERDAKHPDASGYLEVQSIDTETNPVAVTR
jgi:hypothetical protein